MPEPQSANGLSIVMSWGLLDGFITALFTGIGAVTAWVWRLGVRVDKLEVDVMRMREEAVRTTASVEKLEAKLESKIDNILEKIYDLPNRVFIESQIKQLTERVDGVVDASVARRLGRDPH